MRACEDDSDDLRVADLLDSGRVWVSAIPSCSREEEGGREKSVGRDAMREVAEERVRERGGETR